MRRHHTTNILAYVSVLNISVSRSVYINIEFNRGIVINVLIVYNILIIYISVVVYPFTPSNFPE